jgi:predicted ATPase/DNA-binding CsgD family transcriptional regulator
MNKQPVGRDNTQIPSQTNLTHSLSSFIGRKNELAQVHQLLKRTRLLTLMGVGGCGKTRLARQIGTELASTHLFEDGVWFIELAALNDPVLVSQEVAQTLGIRETFGQLIIVSLMDYLADRHLLLVLDNCEHLLTACAQLAEKLLLASPQLQILATSREPLGLVGETTFLIPSLSLPNSAHLPLVSNLTEYDAPALFVERARSVLPTFIPTEQNTAATLQVCRRLDGIPLAIELAAARVNVLTVEQIAARLDDRFTLLAASNRTAVLPRHQTLRATIDWSYDLLSEKERTLFRRLAVFAGSFTLEAVEAICLSNDMEQSEILDGLARLVSKSLVVAEILGQREARYHFLETIRQYALNLLRESGEEHILRDRHRDWYLRLAEKSQAQWRGPRQKEVFHQLETEHDNLRAALEWSKLASDSAEAGLRLGSALWRFWEIHDHLHEGLQHLTDVLTLPQAQAHTVARSKALYGAGYLAMKQGLERDYTASEAFMEESLAIARELDDPQLLANGIYGLGVVARFRGDNEHAEELLSESLRLFRQLGERVGTYTSLYNLAEAATARGDYARAQTLHEESLILKQAQNDEWSIANSLLSLAIVARLQGKHDHSINLLKQSLALFQKIGDTANIALCLREFSAIAATQGHSQLAVQLYASADTILEALGYLSDHAYRAESNHPLANVHSRMGGTRFNTVWESGRALTLDQAIEQAQGLGLLLKQKADSQTPSARDAKDQNLLVPLNEREIEVLRLIAEGLSNHEIAERLVIALSTVKWHINNLFGKLGVHSRTQAVAQAKELGLL